MFDFSDRTVLVTGGGAGIGRAIALGFGKSGAKVAVAEIDATRADAVRAELEAAGVDALVVEADVTLEADVRNVAARIESRFGALDVLVNNVGDYMGVIGSFADISNEDIARLYAVNLNQMFLVTRQMIPLLRRGAPGASIVGISSIEGFRGNPTGAVYGALKAAVTGFTAGEDAGAYAMGNPLPGTDPAYAERIVSRVTAPLRRSGDVDAYEITYRVHEAIVPMEYNRIREAGRMREALGILEEARERLQRVGVADHHDLARYHSAESMLMAAEATYRTALTREESRSQHFREDFPERDDENWFKWIAIEQQDGEAKLSTLPIPVDKYRLQPDRR